MYTKYKLKFLQLQFFLARMESSQSTLNVFFSIFYWHMQLEEMGLSFEAFVPQVDLLNDSRKKLALHKSNHFSAILMLNLTHKKMYFIVLAET